MTEQDIQGLREKYVRPVLHRKDMQADPFDQFHYWFMEALLGNVLEPNAMSLATVDKNGRPSVRTVLFKGITDNNGLSFYTNYESKKGRDIANNDCVSLLFNWLSLHRQIRITGRAIKLSEKESKAYFNRRPRGSQIGAWASNQSEVIADRSVLEENWKNLEQKFEGQDRLPMPPTWGGYEVIADEFEFWQGNDNRLHDRFQYTLGDAWTMERLAP